MPALPNNFNQGQADDHRENNAGEASDEPFKTLYPRSPQQETDIIGSFDQISPTYGAQPSPLPQQLNSESSGRPITPGIPDWTYPVIRAEDPWVNPSDIAQNLYRSANDAGQGESFGPEEALHRNPLADHAGGAILNPDVVSERLLIERQVIRGEYIQGTLRRVDAVGSYEQYNLQDTEHPYALSLSWSSDEGYCVAVPNDEGCFAAVPNDERYFVAVPNDEGHSAAVPNDPGHSVVVSTPIPNARSK